LQQLEALAGPANARRVSRSEQSAIAAALPPSPPQPPPPLLPRAFAASPHVSARYSRLDRAVAAAVALAAPSDERKQSEGKGVVSQLPRAALHSLSSPVLPLASERVPDAPAALLPSIGRAVANAAAGAHRRAPSHALALSPRAATRPSPANVAEMLGAMNMADAAQLEVAAKLRQALRASPQPSAPPPPPLPQQQLQQPPPQAAEPSELLERCYRQIAVLEPPQSGAARVGKLRHPLLWRPVAAAQRP
jgi:hypothetical protein